MYIYIFESLRGQRVLLFKGWSLVTKKPQLDSMKTRRGEEGAGVTFPSSFTGEVPCTHPRDSAETRVHANIHMKQTFNENTTWDCACVVCVCMRTCV